MKWICALVMSAALAQQAPQQLPEKTEPPPAPPAKAAPAAEPAVPDKSSPQKPLSPAEAMRLSIEKQREAVRKQAESAGAWLVPGDLKPSFANSMEPAVPHADCEPLDDAVIAPLIDANAKLQDVKPELLRAVIEQESGYKPCAVSAKGAQGLMQLMPSTVQQLGVKDPFDPKENLAAGAKFLKQLMDNYQGDLSKALRAYNAGSAAVDQVGGVPEVQETKDYVDAILKKLGITRTAPPNIQPPKPIEN